MKIYAFALWLAVAALSAVAGCSKAPTGKLVYPLKGQVVYGGRPIAGATVVFHPLGEAAGAKDEIRPRGRTDAAGNFVLSSLATGDGAPAGDYAVTVELWEAAPSRPHDEASGPSVNRLPAKYARPESSGTTVRVEAGANPPATIELKK